MLREPALLADAVDGERVGLLGLTQRAPGEQDDRVAFAGDGTGEKVLIDGVVPLAERTASGGLGADSGDAAVQGHAAASAGVAGEGDDGNVEAVLAEIAGGAGVLRPADHGDGAEVGGDVPGAVCERGGATVRGGEVDGRVVRRALGAGGFYAELVSCLTYPIPALGSLATAAAAGIGGGLVPVVVMTALTGLMQQGYVGTVREGQKADLTGVSMLLMGIFALELFVFSAIALHLFLDVMRASSIGTPRPPALSWSPSQWGKSFVGYLAFVVYYLVVTYILATLTLDDGVRTLQRNRDLFSLMGSGGQYLVWGLALLSFGVPMNFLGLGMGTMTQAVNPVRVARSIIKTHVHYVFLVLMLCFYGIVFGGMFWAVAHDWFVPQISKMAAGTKEGDLVQVALAMLSWGGVVALYFYGTFVLGRLFGLFARTFRKDLLFGTG